MALIFDWISAADARRADGLGPRAVPLQARPVRRQGQACPQGTVVPPASPSRRLHADLGSGSIGRSTSHAALWLTHAAIAYSRTPAGVPCDPARARPALPAAPRHRARRLALLAPLLLAERLGLAPDAAGTKGTHRQYSPAALAPSGPVDGILRRLALCASALEGARTQGHARTHSLFRIGAYRRAGVGRTCCSRARASTRPPARCRSTAPRQAAASLQTRRSATSRICGRCDGTRVLAGVQR